jgi:methyl coenzyme M reductase gamma subunit
MANKPLSDEEVYDLLHAAMSLLVNKTVRTENGRQVLETAIRDLDILQKALLIMTEGRDPLQTVLEP